MNIVYNDRYILVIEKPPGIISQSSETQHNKDVLSLMSEQMHSKFYCVHRLDRDTGGLMILAKTSKSAAVFSELLRDHKKITKEYLAVVNFNSPISLPIDKKGTMDDLIWYDRTKNRSYIVNRIRKGVKNASLIYEIKQIKQIDAGEIALAEIVLNTGRTHQIRAQFSYRGMPVVGDRHYGDRNNCNMALWAHKLTFVHPFLCQEISLTSLTPDDYPWNIFK